MENEFPAEGFVQFQVILLGPLLSAAGVVVAAVRDESEVAPPPPPPTLAEIGER
jgi:hypothetical protein